MKHGSKKLWSILLALALALGLLPGMSLTAYAAGTLTIDIGDSVNDDNHNGFCIGTDQSIAEGTTVKFDIYTWHTATGHIYINNEVVYTWTGSKYASNVYNFTAEKNCVIKGTPFFDADNNPNIYITQDVSVAVTGVTLDKPTAQTINVNGSVAFTATVSPNNATDKKVKWSVSGAAVKLYTNAACTQEVGTAATTTTTVYAKGMSVGSATVTATSNANSNKFATCTVTVRGVPETGDGADFGLWAVLLMVGLAGMGIALTMGKRGKARR
ncbi:MAG: hypothetical protein IJQ33_07105 [Clostridia bacterium]|nr:hypothetical protein [Clostridia bacterium]